MKCTHYVHNIIIGVKSFDKALRVDNDLKLFSEVASKLLSSSPDERLSI